MKTAFKFFLSVCAVGVSAFAIDVTDIAKEKVKAEMTDTVKEAVEGVVPGSDEDNATKEGSTETPKD